MNKSNVWLPLLASLGVGVATFYTMSKSNRPLDKATETIPPILSSLASDYDAQHQSHTDHFS